MPNDVAIRVTNVSKHYLMFRKPEDRLRQMIIPKVQRFFGRKPSQHYVDFAAVHDVSFEVRRGQTVGIIGRNGSGKSTLLQMVCGTLSPSSGTVEVHGRIAALLELGSGFNPEFTGRENVYLNAAILGLSRDETDARFANIAKFADIDQFLDQPVKTYSSGMQVRLAFAVAINVDPDILIVDEALAVGDEAFQRKCYAKIESLRQEGATILFVSHGAETIVTLCDYAMLMDRGEKILEGKPKRIVNQYQKLVSLTGNEAEELRTAILLEQQSGAPSEDMADKALEEDAKTPQPVQSEEQAWFDPSLVSKSEVEYNSRGARISNVRILDDHGASVNCLIRNRRYMFTFDVSFDEDVESVAFAMFVKSMTGFEIAGRQSHPTSEGIRCEANETVTVHLPFDCFFLPGTYSCNCGVFINHKMSQEIMHRKLDAVLFRVKATDGQQPRQGVVDICPDNQPPQIERHPPTAPA